MKNAKNEATYCIY